MHLTQGLQWVAWNIFLAIIPVIFAYAIVWLVGPNTRGRIGWVKKIGLFLLGVAWFVFLPNTCYLLTEWRHFLEMLGYTNLHMRWQVDGDSALLLMFLTFFYLCYSGIGVLTFAMSVRPIARIMRDRGATLWVWGIPFFILMSAGVYLGLVHRFNSWDLLVEFHAIVSSTLEIGVRPILSAFVLIFAGFLWLLYFITDTWIDGFAYRLSAGRSANRR